MAVLESAAEVLGATISAAFWLWPAAICALAYMRGYRNVWAYVSLALPGIILGPMIALIPLVIPGKTRTSIGLTLGAWGLYLLVLAGTTYWYFGVLVPSTHRNMSGMDVERSSNQLPISSGESEEELGGSAGSLIWPNGRHACVFAASSKEAHARMYQAMQSDPKTLSEMAKSRDMLILEEATKVRVIEVDYQANAIHAIIIDGPQKGTSCWVLKDFFSKD